jgi:hypothetical protein
VKRLIPTIILCLVTCALLRAHGAAPQDDTAALQARLDAPGDTSTFRGVGTIALEARTYRISDTLRVVKRSVILRGQGVSAEGAGGTTFKWVGPAGKPLLQLQQAQFCQVSGIHFAGDAKALPSAAINITQGPGDVVPTAKNSFRDLAIGSLYGFDDDQRQFAAGVLFDGVNGNGDMNTFGNLLIWKCGTGIDIRNSQNTMNAFRDCLIFGCDTGVNCQAENKLENLFCSNNGVDLRITESIRLTIDGFASESSGRLATFTGQGGSLTLRSGNWQVSPGIAVDGTVIAGVQVAPVDVTFQDFTLTTAAGYTGPPPKIRLKSPPGGQGQKTFIGLGVPNFDPAWLDMDTNKPKRDFPFEQRVIQVVRPGRSGVGAFPGAVFSNLVDGDGKVDLSRFDLPPHESPQPKRVQAQATIPRGRTFVVVEHGLGGQPAIEDIGVVVDGTVRAWLAGATDKTLAFRIEKPAPVAGIVFTYSATLK